MVFLKPRDMRLGLFKSYIEIALEWRDWPPFVLCPDASPGIYADDALGRIFTIFINK